MSSITGKSRETADKKAVYYVGTPITPAHKGLELSQRGVAHSKALVLQCIDEQA